MHSDAVLADLAHSIQLAVAPVFLLTAIGTILSVLSLRLGRIVDRVRVLTPINGPVGVEAERERTLELTSLSSRRRLINYAITFATLAALQVCFLISLVFLGFMVNTNFSLAIAGLFIGAMAAFTFALLLFLREILVAVAGMRIQ